MNNLPTEIIAEITKVFPFSNKLNLACVCKKLKVALSETTLYTTLFCRGDYNLYKAMDLLYEKKLG